MKKFKDFIYDKNDIFIALLILILAAIIIIWRMNAIMAYPEKMLAANQPDTTQQDDAQQDDQTNDGNHDGNDTQNDPPADNPQQADNPDDAQTPDPTDTQTTDGELWHGSTLARDITVDMQGSTASEAVECLIDAGLFEDYAEYQHICKDAGLDHEKVSGGSFTFKAGDTKADIARAINWG